MQLLSPLGLLALTSVIVPLLIHLWNVKQGKTLKIGSISLLGEGAAMSSKSLKITDWFLLLLRCLLFVLLVFILCEPYVTLPLKADFGKGWIVVRRSELQVVYSNNRITIDSLLKSGYQLRDFNADFEPMVLGDTSAPVAVSSVLSETSLLRQLNAGLPSGFSVYLYSDKYLANLKEPIPLFRFNLHWLPTGSSDSVSSWTSKYAGNLYRAKSTALFTKYNRLPKPVADTLVTSVLIYNKGNDADVRYIKSALSAIYDYGGRKLTIAVTNTKSKINANSDIIFWLSDEPADKDFISTLKKDARLFSYEKGKVEEVSSFVNVGLDRQFEKDALLYRKIVPAQVPGNVLWQDYLGDPLLTVEHNKFLHFHLYMKLNQEWTSMVWEDTFVRSLLPLVTGTADEPSDFGFEEHPADKRLRSIHRDAMSMTKAKMLPVNPQVPVTEQLDFPFWLAAVLVFILERWFSLRKN